MRAAVICTGANRRSTVHTQKTTRLGKSLAAAATTRIQDNPAHNAARALFESASMQKRNLECAMGSTCGVCIAVKTHTHTQNRERSVRSCHYSLSLSSLSSLSSTPFLPFLSGASHSPRAAASAAASTPPLPSSSTSSSPSPSFFPSCFFFL